MRSQRLTLEDPIRIKFQLVPHDFYDAFRARNAKRRRIREGVIALLALIYVVVDIEEGVYGIARGAAVIAVICFFGVVLARALERLSFRLAHLGQQSSEHLHDLAINISEAGIQKAGSEAIQPWSDFSSFSESKSSFILYRAKTICAIFPKRAFHQSGINGLSKFLLYTLPRR